MEQIKLEPSIVSNAAEVFAEEAINEVVQANDWDFACNETTHSGGTTDGEGQYTLEGANTDAQSIIWIKYSSDEDLLTKMTPNQLARFLHNRTHSITNIWVPDGRVNGFPRVKLVATPGEDSVQIKYRYKMKSVTLTEYPDEYDYVITSGVLKRLLPVYSSIFENDLARMISTYESASGDESPAILDPHLIDSNNRRHTLYGYN